MITEKRREYFNNIKNFLKGRSDKIKSEISNLSEKIKKKIPHESPKKGSKIPFEKNDNNDPKSIFHIEEDEECKAYNYILDDDEDEIEYEEDDETNDQEPDKNKAKSEQNNIETKPETIVENNKKLSEMPDWEENIDLDLICHRIYLKDMEVDLECLPYVKCTKLKPKNKIAKYVNFGKNNKIETNYILLLDEFFLYIIKDIITDKSNRLIKKVNKHYDIRKLTMIIMKNMEDNKLSFSLIFSFKKNEKEVTESKIKEFNLDYDQSVLFYKYLRFFIKKFNLSPIINEIN